MLIHTCRHFARICLGFDQTGYKITDPRHAIVHEPDGDENCFEVYEHLRWLTVCTSAQSNRLLVVVVATLGCLVTTRLFCVKVIVVYALVSYSS